MLRWGFLYGAVLAATLAIAWITVQIVLKAKTNQMLRRQQEYRAITDQALRCIAKTIDAKDPYTKGHSARVAAYSAELARRLSFSEQETENIYYIALMHDIGKIGVPDSILNKPESLTPAEMEIVKRHPQTGGEILKEFTALPGISDGARYHHERMDGSGYNEGLSGEEIPLCARIIGVADAYDAMTSARVYSPGQTKEEAVAELQRGAGTQFDACIVHAFAKMIAEGVDIS